MHRGTDANRTHQKDNSPKPINHRLTLKVEPEVKSDHIKRFLAHDFLYVCVTLQTSRTKNKPVISTFKFGYPCLTLKEGPKVKSDNIRRFPAHDFTLQTSRTNNKQVISNFKFGYPRLTWKEWSKSNLTTSEDSQPMIS